MLAIKCKIKKDDKVKVIAGKDKGKIGKILKVNHKKNRVLVENVNIVKRHTKPTAKTRQGGHRRRRGCNPDFQCDDYVRQVCFCGAG